MQLGLDELIVVRNFVVLEQILAVPSMTVGVDAVGQSGYGTERRSLTATFGRQ
ncbi:MAG: hypothetical protein OXH72_01280 [Caldilineaceae bacterium]|nr:hypothetical protein [Caldilineaceae bacterium]